MTTRNIAADDGVHIAVHTSGDGPRRVLFIHGWMASSHAWDALWPHLSMDGLSCARVDLRGTGGSDRPAGGYTLARYGADLVQVVDALGWDRFSVVGHSMGGQLGQWLAVQLGPRVEGLCAICPVPQSGMPMPDEASSLFRAAGGVRSKLGLILELATKDITPERMQLLLDDATSISATCITEGFSAWSQGFPADLAQVSAPTLVLGSDDPFLLLPLLKSQIVQKIPRARLAYLPGAGHYPQFERPLQTAAIIDAFLAGLG